MTKDELAELLADEDGEVVFLALDPEEQEELDFAEAVDSESGHWEIEWNEVKYADADLDSLCEKLRAEGCPGRCFWDAVRFVPDKTVHFMGKVLKIW